jgi:hypothetical protein
MSREQLVGPDHHVIGRDGALRRERREADLFRWLLFHRCAERPSWDQVEEYLREQKHTALVEKYAREHPDFAEVLRWMRNELEDEGDRSTPTPASDKGPGSHTPPAR